MQCVIFILVLFSINQILCESEGTLIKTLARQTPDLTSELTSEENESLSNDDSVSGADDASVSADNEESIDQLSQIDMKDDDDMKLHLESKEDVMSEDALKRFIVELLSGNAADLLGSNPNYHQPDMYKDLGRRYVLQYPYNDLSKKFKKPDFAEKIIPELASPELVLAVAKKSALLQASQPHNPTDDIIRKEILRTGDYWNDVWREDVNPNRILRSLNKKKNNLETVKVKFLPAWELNEKFKRLTSKASFKFH